MVKTRIYQNQELHPEQACQLNSTGANHVARVLRMKTNNKIILFNGDNYIYPAIITEITKNNVTVKIQDKILDNRESPLSIHLYQAISRGDKMDFTIQKSVELGVTEITPVFTQRCGVKLNQERLDKKLQHWNKIIISACEQSGRNTIPTLHPATDLKNIESTDNTDNTDNTHKVSLVLDPTAKQSLKTLPKTINKLNLLFGSEGGFTDEEIEILTTKNFTPTTLGPRILRTETAALTCISALQLTHGDLG